MTSASTIMASIRVPEEPINIFSDSFGVTGYIVIAIFFMGIMIWTVTAWIRYRRVKQQEQMPGVLGDPKGLLESVCNLIELEGYDRYLLKKIAFRMKLPQPVSLLLSPALLVEGSAVWQETCWFGPMQSWGVGRLDLIAQRIYGQPLSQLEDGGRRER